MPNKRVKSILPTLVLAACADTHELMRRDPVLPVRLLASDSIYVAVSQDGVYGSKQYAGSGKTTSQLLTSAFARRADKAVMGAAYQDQVAAIDYAKTNTYGYLIYPTILHWEDRATEWSAIPDRVEVKVAIIDVVSDKILDSAVITGKSGLWTFGGDHPQDLLPKPIEEFVSTLYK